MHRFLRLLVVGLAVAFAVPAAAGPKKTFKIGYSVYVGFEPLEWIKSSGAMKRWADKYGIEVEIVQINDYVGSINQLIAGDLDAVGAASMDQLTMPAAGGVETSLFLIADYSNGNDAIVSKTAGSVKELEGKELHLLQYSVSHYLLNRALIINGMKGVGAVKTTNISDSEISAAFVSQPQVEHAVSWKPMVPDMLKGAPGSKVLFDSSQIPGEIMDVFIAKTETLKDNPDFAKAFVGAWYEALGHLKEGGAKGDEVKSVMASALGTDAAGLKTQMDTTHFFFAAKEAADFLSAPKTKEIWDYVRTFCFEQGLYGQGADSVDAIGIEMSDGSVLGSEKNVKIRIDPSFVTLAADGKLYGADEALMRRIVNYVPSSAAKAALGGAIAIAVAAYLIASDARLAANPGDKIMPALSSIYAAMERLISRVDPAAGQPLFWFDTWLSLWRLGVGLGISAMVGLALGVLVGFIPYVRATFEPIIAALSLVPPLAVLPILFIAFGLGETSKIVLIVFGVAPVMVRDVMLAVAAIPREQIVKAQTLGASTWQMILDVVLPQVLPRLIDTVRLSLGATWLFVIAAEAITAEGGLGYRIFLVRRYLAMDVILPYVLWIALLAFVLDFALRKLSAFAFPWTGLKDG